MSISINKRILEKAKQKGLDQKYIESIDFVKTFDFNYIKLGDLLLDLEEYEEALKVYEYVINKKKDINTNHTPVYDALINVYLYGTFSKDQKSNIFTKPDSKKAIKILESKYKYYEIGLIYYYGKANEKINYKLAYEYLKKSHTSSIELAHCYYYGRGVEQNKAEAFKIYSYLDSNDEEYIKNLIDSSKEYKFFDFIYSNNNQDKVAIEKLIDILIKRNNYDEIYSLARNLLFNRKPYISLSEIKKEYASKCYQELVNYYDTIQLNPLAKSRYIEAYEYITKENERNSINYKIIKTEKGSKDYYFEVGMYYTQEPHKNIELANRYLNDYFISIENKVKNNDIESSKTYIYLCESLNKNKNNFYYLLAKALLKDEPSLLTIGLLYLEGKHVNKDENKAKEYLKEYCKLLEKYITEENPSHLDEYVKLYEFLYDPKLLEFKYCLAKALLKDPYFMFVLATKYEEGFEVEKDIEKAKKYYKASYEGGFNGAYDRYQFYFGMHTKSNIDIFKTIRYIQLLELNEDEDITIEDLKKNYRQLSQIYHPDIANSRYSDGKKFMELKKAYDYLLENIYEINKVVKDYILK